MFSFSTTSWVIFGLVAIVVVAVVWKLWKTPKPVEHEAEQVLIENKADIVEATTGPPKSDLSSFGTPPPPMVFAVNDDGNFDLADMSGKLLNIGFGPNPKTYINLLDRAEKDIIKNEMGNMISQVGPTKSYEVGGHTYIVNFTRL
jgi:hypothetical protein